MRAPLSSTLALPMRTFCTLVFLAANLGSIAIAQDSLSGAYSEAPKLLGSTIKIQRLSPTTASLHVSLSSRSCGGEISGTAKVEGSRLTLTKEIDGKNCLLIVQVTGRTASVLREDGCTGFHGASCSFAEQATNLPRRRGANPALQGTPASGRP